jgi:hypothetical protein
VRRITQDATVGATSDQYAVLTKYIVGKITDAAPFPTLRLERNVVLQGKASSNQIDVLWQFQDGTRTRMVLFECRAYASSLKQSAIHAWRGVLDDVSSVTGPCEGAMVTSTGYQRGARAVAETYGILILELRQPNDLDVAGRVLEVRLQITARAPYFEEVLVEGEELHVEAGPRNSWSPDLSLRHGDGTEELLADVLLAGELSALDADPTPRHSVERMFDPAVTLLDAGTPIAEVRCVRAMVGERQGEPTTTIIGGRDRLAWVLKDTLDGTCVWFTNDGQHYVTRLSRVS